MRPKLIVFDLNKTLIKENSWRDLNLAMGVTPDEDAELMARAQRGEITDAEGQAGLLKIYQERGDVSKGNIKRILNGYTFKPYARETVLELQKRAYKIAIISGAMDLLVEKVAKDLDILLWRAGNKFIFDDNNQLQEIIAPDNDGENKLRQLQRLAADCQISLDECLVIGDGANDLPLFQATGNGATFAGSKIEQQARFVVDNLSEICQIVA